MKLLIGIVIALFIAVGVALLLREDPGYVLVTIGQWTIETTVAALVFITIVSFVVLYKLIRYTVRLWAMPAYVKAATEQRRLRRSQKLLTLGEKELAEGRWEAAESHLLKGAEYSETPEWHYIGAARAAHKLHAGWRRDLHLRRAKELPEKDTLLVGIAEAELYLEDHQPAKAKAILEKLQDDHPRQPRVLELLMQSYRGLGEWEKLRDILPDLRKRKLLNEQEYAELQLQVYRELLAKIASTGTLEELRAFWKKLPKPLRQEESLIIDYAGYLQENDAAAEAETLLRNALNRQWSDKLVVGYGQIGRADAAAQLKVAEGWLPQQDKNSYLLLTLGRLAKRSRQWDKARDYLEQSIKLLPTSDAYEELGEILEQTQDRERANLCYRTGLRILSGRTEKEKRAVEVLPPPIEGKGEPLLQPQGKAVT